MLRGGRMKLRAACKVFRKALPFASEDQPVSTLALPSRLHEMSPCASCLANVRSTWNDASCGGPANPCMSSRRSSISFCHLIRHRDRVVSKDQLLEAVWQGRVVSELRTQHAHQCRPAGHRRQRRSAEIHSDTARRGFRFVADRRGGDLDGRGCCRHACVRRPNLRIGPRSRYWPSTIW